MLLSDELPTTNEEHLNRGTVFIGDDRHHILITASGIDDLLAFNNGLEGIYLIAKLCRTLEFQPIRGCLHVRL